MEPRIANLQFGAFIYPKYALQSLEKNFADLTQDAMDELVGDINEINNALYKFSLERLQKFMQ